MAESTDKGFKVVNLKRSQRKEGYWTFAVMSNGLIFNGFTRCPPREGRQPAILGPVDRLRRRLVRGHGIHWKRLSQAVESLIAFAEREEQQFAKVVAELRQP